MAGPHPPAPPYVARVPAAIYSGGYAPGLVTALLLNLPVDAAYLWCTRRFRRAA